MCPEKFGNIYDYLPKPLRKDKFKLGKFMAGMITEITKLGYLYSSPNPLIVLKQPRNNHFHQCAEISVHRMVGFFTQWADFSALRY